VPAKLDIDGSPELPQRKRGRPPRVPAEAHESEPLPIDSDASLRLLADNIDEVRISVNQLGEDVLQRLADNAKAQAIVSDGGVKELAGNVAKLTATVAAQNETITFMIGRYDTSTAMLAACDRLTRVRCEQMTKELNAVLAKHLKVAAEESTVKPMPLWQLCVLWLLAPVVLFLALFGLWQLLG
jgi:hypothetical protein